MAFRRDLALLRTGSAALRIIPGDPAGRLAHKVGSAVASRVSGAAALERNLAAVQVSDPKAAAQRGIGAYAKYWVDTLRLPYLSDAAIDRRFSFLNYHYILDVAAAGSTPIMVLPHLGSWEWAAAWLGKVDHQPVTAVVERLEPPEVFQWFQKTREQYGVEVVPLGPDAMQVLMRVIKDGSSVLCLLADRDIAGTGVDVRFFGRSTRMPAGPAVLSLRSGSPLLPVAIYDRGATRQCVVGAPLWPERQGKLRDDVRRITQTVAQELEALVSEAPDQWHVLSDLWPSEPLS